MENNTFWGRAKPLIKAHKLTQQQFADFLGVPFNTLKTWMLRDRIPEIRGAYAIAFALGVTLDYLLHGKDRDLTAIRLREIEARIAVSRAGMLLEQIQKELSQVRPAPASTKQEWSG